MLFSKLRTKNIVYGTSESQAKFWMVIAAVLLIINLFMVLTLMQMAPKLQMIAQVLTVSPMQSNQLLQTEPFSDRTGDKELLDEALLRYYLEMRYTTFQDSQEMNYRWGGAGPLARLSAPNVYDSFAKGLKDRLGAVTSGQKTTSIDIISISRLDNIFTIEFDVYTFQQNKAVPSRKVAVVTIGYDPGRKFFGAQYSNPFGLYVRSYEESAKKI